MSLAEAVLEIAQEMTEEADSREPSGGKVDVRILRCYARELRRLLLVNKPVSPLYGEDAAEAAPDPILAQCPPGIQAAVLSQREKARQRLAREQGREDTDGDDMRVLVGGPHDGDLIRVGCIPVGAYTPVAAEVYQLREDGKLHHSPEQTERLKNTARVAAVPQPADESPKIILPS